jgi:hypothetical protein
MRKLRMTRKKTFVASIMKSYLYVEVEGKGELNIKGTECSRVATFKNGESVTVDITNNETTIIVVFDKNFPNKYHTKYKLSAGEEDVQLYTKARFNPLKGNPFTISEM